MLRFQNQKQRKRVSQSVKSLTPFNTRFLIKERLANLSGGKGQLHPSENDNRNQTELESITQAEQILERTELALLAEDLSISGASQFEDSDDESLDEEFVEKADHLLMQETLRLRKQSGLAQFGELRQALEDKLFDKQFYSRRGLDDDVLKKQIQEDWREDIYKTLKAENTSLKQIETKNRTITRSKHDYFSSAQSISHISDNQQQNKKKSAGNQTKAKVQDNAENPESPQSTIQQSSDFEKANKDLSKLEVKALVLGRMNGMEKSHCIQTLKRSALLLRHLKVTERDLQKQYEQLVSRSRLQNI